MAPVVPVAVPDRRSGSPWTLVILAGGLIGLIALTDLSFVASMVAIFLQVVFFAFFLRHLTFAVSAIRSAPVDLRAPLIDSGYRPTISTIVACKNESTVIDGLVESLVNLEYPRYALQVLIVDDASTDGTGERLDELAQLHPELEVIHRPAGAGGGKSGALNTGLEHALGEVIVVFDADHQPQADVLLRLARHFEDPGVAAVQGRCEIKNPGDSPLTRLVSIDYLAGYLVNEYGRQSLFHLPAYGGANCAVRASALRAAGGWNPGSVTEDTDLTLRLVLNGYRVRYDLTAVDREEGVISLERYWRQRYRWARGHQQVWRDYRSATLRSPHLSRMEKLESIMFLLVFHLPVLSAVGLGLLLGSFTGVVNSIGGVESFVLWTLLFLGPLLELGGALLVAQSERRNALVLPLFLPIFFISIALCTKAWLDAILGREYDWVKTQRSAEPDVLARTRDA